jgi:predicted XRE-type DNA-binding protein
MGAAGGTEPDPDPFLAALDDLLAVLADLGDDARFITRRAQQIRRLRQRGAPYSEIVTAAERPLIVERLRRQVAALMETAGRVQRSEARALHDEGMSMERIGSLFGLTRQRVSDLVRVDHRPAV